MKLGLHMPSAPKPTPDQVRERQKSSMYYTWLFPSPNGEIGHDPVQSLRHVHVPLFNIRSEMKAREMRSLPKLIHRKLLDRFSFYHHDR